MMGKRSNMKRNPKDFYETKLSSVKILIPYLEDKISYTDPCYGSGKIEQHLDELKPEMICSARYELYPKEYTVDVPVHKADAGCHEYKNVSNYFITNPPWQTKAKDKNNKLLPKHMQPLHRVINNLASQKPTWLLFHSDWAYTVQAKPYLEYCVKIVAVGRVKWIEGSKHTGMENASWYLFDKNHTGPTEFFGR